MTGSETERFDRVVLIFNPDPDKAPRRLARALHAAVRQRMPGTPVHERPTHWAGHGRELARAEAGRGRPLLVSVSGDGGFNDVVNGIMDVPGNTAVAAVMAGGNANDHHRSTHRQPLLEAIVDSEVRHIDLLRLSVGEGSECWTRLAHSYIGFGLTPLMAIGMNAGRKGVLRELAAVMRTLGGLEPFELVRSDGARAVLDSLVLANIAHMAKYGRISDSGYPADGKFEVVMLPHAGRWSLALMTLRAVTIGLGRQPRVGRYAFRTTRGIPVQTDGELLTVPADTAVVIESVPGALPVIG